MTPAERLVLRVLMEEYRTESNGEYGPWGRAGRRLGMHAYDVAMIEDRVVGYPDANEREKHFEAGDSNEFLASRIEAVL